MRFVILFCSFLIYTCSSPSEVEEAGIDSGEVEVYSNVLARSLLVTNSSSKNIYYFVYKPDSFLIIDWVPGFNEQYMINAFQQKNILFKDIYRDDGKELGIGDKILFYWWTKDWNDFHDLKYTVVIL